MKQRIITALIALGIFLPLALYGKWPFTLLILIVAAISILEFLRMRQYHQFIIPSILSVSAVLLFILPAGNILNGYIDKMQLFVLFILLLLLYTVISNNRFTFDHVGFVLGATLYVAISFFYLVAARQTGLDYFFYVLIVIWATDTGAYFTGRALGRRQLWPAISPNKTVEGALGGIVWACLFAVIYQLITGMPVVIPILLLITVIASVAGQLGDLVESAFKRYYGVKDTGRILPGHGGLLDRFDSMLFVFPVLHLIGFI